MLVPFVAPSQKGAKEGDHHDCDGFFSLNLFVDIKLHLWVPSVSHGRGVLNSCKFFKCPSRPDCLESRRVRQSRREALWSRTTGESPASVWPGWPSPPSCSRESGRSPPSRAPITSITSSAATDTTSVPAASRST